MKIGWKLLAVLRATAILEGMYTQYLDEHKEVDKEKKLWVSMMWINDWFKTKNGHYYLGIDPATEHYIVEWRGRLHEDDNLQKNLVLSIPAEFWYIDMGKVILKAIKEHKKYFEENMEES